MALLDLESQFYVFQGSTPAKKNKLPWKPGEKGLFRIVFVIRIWVLFYIYDIRGER